MKKIYFTIFILLQLFIVSCNKDPMMGNPEIRLSKDELRFMAEGGSDIITYSIVNAVDGSILSAETDATWIKIDCSGENVIKVETEENPDSDIRKAIIPLYYNSDSALDSLVVIQEGNVNAPDGEEPFEIKTRDIGLESAIVEIIPADPDMTYAPISVTADVFEEISSGDLYDGIVSYLWSLAADNGMSISDFLKSYILIKGSQTFPVKGLYPGDTYYVMAVGMDSKAEPLSKPVCESYTTKEVEMNGATFDISYEIGRPNVVMSVVPSSPSIYYYYDALRKKDVENMGISLEESLKSFFDEAIAMGAYYGMTREEVMKELLSQGPSSFEYTTLQASATYIGVAVSVMLESYINSEMTMKEFETEAVVLSDNKLTLEVSNIQVDHVDISIETTNDDQYCMVVTETSMWPGMTPEECMQKLVEDYSLEQNTNSGNTSGTMKGLQADTEYIVLLFGYSNGRPTTELVYEKFRTREEGNPENLTFETRFSNVLSNSLTVELIPVPDNALFTATLIESSFDEEDVYEYLELTADYYIGAGAVTSLEDFLLKISVRGKQIVEFDKLYSETEYKMFAVGIYPESGKYATDIYFSQPVMTEARIVSDVSITLKADKYFNGDEVAELYPEHSSAKGRAVMTVKAMPEGNNMEKYYYHMFYNDLSDPESAPDDALIMSLTSPLGGISNPETTFYCTYDQVYTLVAVAKDSNGNFGKVYRQVVKCVEDGCSPVDEFNPSESKASSTRSYEHRINASLTLEDTDTSVISPLKAKAADTESPQLWIRMTESAKYGDRK